MSSVFAAKAAAGRSAPAVRTGPGAGSGRGSGPAPKSSAAGKSSISAPKSSKAYAPSPKAKAKLATGARPTSASADEDAQDGGVLTCANKGLLQKMLSDVVEDDDDDDDNDDDGDAQGGNLHMSLRNVTIAPSTQVRNVPTITSPAAQVRPQSRGGVISVSMLAEERPVSRGGLESQARPNSRGGIETMDLQHGRQGPPGASVQVVTTGPPRSTASTYVSAPRPGSRGASMGGEVVTMSPAHRGRQPVRAVQPPRATGVPATAVRTGPPGSGYAGMHQARAQKPASPAAVPAAKPAARPLCGPAAFDFLKKMEEKKPQAAPVTDPPLPGLADVMAEHDEDMEGFVMPASDPESEDDGPRQHVKQPHATQAADPEDSAAAYVEHVKRGLAQEGSSKQVCPESGYPNAAEQRRPAPTGDVAAAFAQLGLAPPSAPVAAPSARARSSDTRQEAGSAQAPAQRNVRSRSSDPRAHVAAARAYSPQVSDDEDDDDDEDEVSQRPGIQWKANDARSLVAADVKSMVKKFAQEERTRQAKPTGSGQKSSGDGAQKPPRAPAPAQADARKVASLMEEAPTVVSKKPRVPVDYTPATLDDYKQRYGNKAEKTELGHLGPDLDDEGLMMKKAMQEKVKQFSKELTRINRQRSVTAASQPKEPAPKPEPKPNARSKALEFAKNIPKPKVAPATKAQVVVTPTKPPEEDQEAADLEEIWRREKQHFEDVAKVAQVKDFLKQLLV